MNKKGKTSTVVTGITVGFLVVVLMLGFLIFNQESQSVANAPAGDRGEGVIQCSYQPTASYSGKDVESTTVVSGTSYYKDNGKAATTTAITNVAGGGVYKYWISNGTDYYVAPKTFTATCGPNSIVADAYDNGTVTITGYDTDNRASIQNGLYNTSMAAGKTANIEITLSPTNDDYFMPFGGVAVVEYNSSITGGVTLTGDAIGGTQFPITYSVSTTSNTYKVFPIRQGWDDGTASTKKLSLQFVNGNVAAGAGAVFYVKFIPANYYLSNAGEIELGVEKDKNSDSTRVGLSQPTLTGYWA